MIKFTWSNNKTIYVTREQIVWIEVGKNEVWLHLSTGDVISIKEKIERVIAHIDLYDKNNTKRKVQK